MEQLQHDTIGNSASDSDAWMPSVHRLRRALIKHQEMQFSPQRSDASLSPSPLQLSCRTVRQIATDASTYDLKSILFNHKPGVRKNNSSPKVRSLLQVIVEILQAGDARGRRFDCERVESREER